MMLLSLCCKSLEPFDCGAENLLQAMHPHSGDYFLVGPTVTPALHQTMLHHAILIKKMKAVVILSWLTITFERDSKCFQAQGWEVRGYCFISFSTLRLHNFSQSVLDETLLHYQEPDQFCWKVLKIYTYYDCSGVLQPVVTNVIWLPTNVFFGNLCNICS